MASKPNQKIAIIAVAAIVLILGITATFVIIEAQSSRSDLPVLGVVPEFQLTTSTGLDFGSKDMKGKISVVDFFFTSCEGPCPIMADQMSSLYRAFAGSSRIQFISISVDPGRDRLQALQDYARRQSVIDDRWVFLRGDKTEIKWLSEDVFKLAADDLPATHSTKFVLVDDKGQIRGYYSGTDKTSINILKTHVRELAQNLK